MKINMVLPGIGHSGGVQMAIDYLNYFARHDNDVICYVPFTGAYYGWKRILFPKAMYRIIKSKDLQGKWISHKINIKFVPYINNLYVRDADITIATSWLTSYWVYNLKQEKGAKVYFVQDFETWGNDKENNKVKASYQLPYDLRISVSTELHDRLIQETKASSIVICNGLPKESIRKFPKINSEKLVIGFPFREKRAVQQDIKNTEFGTNSLLKFVHENPEIKVKTFGFKKPIEFPKPIEFLENPSKDELNKWYDSIDIFYVPSLYEGWGLPAMEAMARGCAVIGANTGCLKEFGKHLENCYKINNMTNQQELFQGLELLIKADDLRQKISENAIKIVNNYTFENKAQKFLELLEKLNSEGAIN